MPSFRGAAAVPIVGLGGRLRNALKLGRKPFFVISRPVSDTGHLAGSETPPQSPVTGHNPVDQPRREAIEQQPKPARPAGDEFRACRARSPARSGGQPGRPASAAVRSREAFVFDERVEMFAAPLGRARRRGRRFQSRKFRPHGFAETVQCELAGRVLALMRRRRSPRIEPMLTTIGCWPSRNSGIASRMNSTGAKKLTSMIGRRRAGIGIGESGRGRRCPRC